ncbi:hypothetical protein [Steroidobacter sp.]|uniref:hypothetical protein n=1 Tax=Steroidobacter sp. TaxID=1978227 RepID=UPI001A6267C9|nr:hypothetical protein [Steroidobacter sp.]MBL8270750.1 hypothetical protein [Steroidobacter sp.]
MKTAIANNQIPLSPVMRLANCFADAVVDDLIKQHERELEADQTKPDRSDLSARRRSPVRDSVSEFRAKLEARGIRGNDAWWSMLEHRSTPRRTRA